MIDAYPWAALAVAILYPRFLNPDHAYAVLETGRCKNKKIEFTQADKEQMRWLIDQGYTLQTVAEHFDISRQTLSRNLADADKIREEQRRYDRDRKRKCRERAMGVVG